MARVDYIDFIDFSLPCTFKGWCSSCRLRARCWLDADLDIITAEDEGYTMLYSEGES